MEHEVWHILGGITPKQTKALPLLAAGESAVEVSIKVKVSKQTISGWKHDPKFTDALEEVRREAFSEANKALAELAMDSVRTVKELMSNAESEQVRLRAAMFAIDKLDLKYLGDNAFTGGKVDMDMMFKSLGIEW